MPELKERPMITQLWKPMRDGMIPDGAPAYGHEANGDPLFIARAIYNNGLHPGKVRPAFKAANIPYGGQEIKIPEYEVFMGCDTCRWVATTGDHIPDGAVVFGHENDGTPLYVARAQVEGGLHLGKVRPGFHGANIPYGGKELQGIKDYEVLCMF